MIITITCNPAIDKTIKDNNTIFDIGGKGINVSKVLKSLGVDSICTGFIGKDNKNIIYDKLDELDIKHHFIEIEGAIRTNTKRIINNELIEENEKGPTPIKEDINNLINYLKQFKNEIVVISGSSNVNIYYDLVKLLKKNNNYVILDADKDLLVDGIKGCPNIIKPNKDEISRLFNIDYDEKVVTKKCKELNMDLICISLGKDGALFINKDTVYKAKALDVKYASAVGAGDAMVASFAYSKLNNYDIKNTISLAIAASCASVETSGTKPPNKDKVFAYQKEVKVELV